MTDEPTKPVNRRNVLKAIGAGAATTTIASGASTAHDGDCSGESVPDPDDSDCYVFIHYSPGCDFGSSGANEIANYVENEFNDHVNSMTFNATVEGELTYTEIMDHSTSDDVFVAFSDYIEETDYNGDWSGSQGYWDFYFFDPAAWKEGPECGATYTAGFYNGGNAGGSKGDWNNPWPTGVADGTDDNNNCSGSGLDDHKYSIKHELLHALMIRGTDSYDYNQNDHDVMSESSSDLLDVGDLAGTFVDHAYEYGWVYYDAPTSVYNCEDGTHVQ